MRFFLAAIILCLPFSGCLSLGKKRPPKVDMTPVIESELNQFFGPLDAEASLMIYRPVEEAPEEFQ